VKHPKHRLDLDTLSESLRSWSGEHEENRAFKTWTSHLNYEYPLTSGLCFRDRHNVMVCILYSPTFTSDPTPHALQSMEIGEQHKTSTANTMICFFYREVRWKASKSLIEEWNFRREWYSHRLGCYFVK
jgi:hypothetical protein